MTLPSTGRYSSRMLPDPPIPPDGSCAECGKPRKLSGLKPLYRRAAEADPFCSSACARAWHGCPLREGTHGRMTAGA